MAKQEAALPCSSTFFYLGRGGVVTADSRQQQSQQQGTALEADMQSMVGVL
jgi:hypothetical protein